MKLLRHFKIVWIINLTVYLIFYLGKTFIIWSFKNPFQPIINIPLLTENDRANLLGWLVVYQFCLHFLVLGATFNSLVDAKN